jgi:hypothetical protein
MAKIRAWKLGNLEHQIYPTQTAIDKLAKLLEDARNSSEEFVDIIWGPDLSVEVVDDTDWDVIVAPQPDGTQKITVY